MRDNEVGVSAAMFDGLRHEMYTANKMKFVLMIKIVPPLVMMMGDDESR